MAPPVLINELALPACFNIDLDLAADFAARPVALFVMPFVTPLRAPLAKAPPV